MKNLLRSKNVLFGVVGLAVAALLVACGGAGQDEQAASDPVAETERQQALGLFDKLPVSWAPTQLVFSLNPGSVQTVPVTLTTKKALTNAKIVFVPDLRNAVTVTPEVIPTLAAGQTATVTLTFAPKATDTRRLIAGVVLLFDKNATISAPLPVKVSLVKAETINGVVVPPEPPANLNNATLAGFDVNGNGVRDDVERLLATQFGGSPQGRIQALMDFSKAQQTAIATGLPSPVADSDRVFICSGLRPSETNQLTTVLLNTGARKFAYKTVMSKSPSINIGAIKRSCPR
jgi:hypothetical protein